MTDFQTVTYSINNQVAMIGMNRPEALNSFNTQLRLDLLAAIDCANKDEKVRVVVITGEGRSFSAGHDLASGYGNHDTIEETILKEYKPLMEAIDGSDKLYISAINGAAAGIGASLAMMCDLSVMADDGYMYFAFAAIGLVLDGGASYHLVRKLGYTKAVELVMEAEKIPADECISLGLVNKLVPASELRVCAQHWAEKFAEGAPLAQKYNKQLLKAAMESDLNSMIALEAETQNIASATEDFKIATEAFFKKVKPKFTGR
jgi:2-(1,2-epoxy-1,2-dihydrophenyl)acetyl-CoA isomerase